MIVLVWSRVYVNLGSISIKIYGILVVLLSILGSIYGAISIAVWWNSSKVDQVTTIVL